MGGKMSRNKGAAGEREIAKLLQKYGFPGKRTAQHMGKCGGMADVVGMDGYHLEVKRCETLSIYAAMEQAIRDKAADEKPVVLHRRNGRPWLVVMLAEDWLEGEQNAL